MCAVCNVFSVCSVHYKIGVQCVQCAVFTLPCRASQGLVQGFFCLLWQPGCTLCKEVETVRRSESHTVPQSNTHRVKSHRVTESQSHKQQGKCNDRVGRRLCNFFLGWGKMLPLDICFCVCVKCALAVVILRIFLPFCG